MHCFLQSGNYVIINKDRRDFRNKDIVVASIDGALTLKEFQKIDKNTIGLFPKSKNTDHKPIYLSNKDEFLIIGRVIDIYKS